MGGMDLQELIDITRPINEKLTLLKGSITEAYDTLTTVDEKELVIKAQIDDYKKKADMYDRLFQEKEAALQRNGGRERQETLQEYCLYFFYIAYGIFILSLALFYSAGEGVGKTIPLIITSLVMLLPITGLIMMYS
jgi:hypothetical protein